MEFHEAANILPMDEEHIPELAENIRQNGLIDDIELFDGKILDGRRRFQACGIAGVKPRFKNVNPPCPVAYVISKSTRRNLSQTQWAMVGARAEKLIEKLREEAKERQKESGRVHGRGKEKVVENFPQPNDGDSGKTRDKIGQLVGVSGKSIDSASRVLKNGTPKLIEAVEDDKIAVSTAARMSSLPPERQDEFVESAKGRPGARKPDAPDDPEPQSNGKVIGKGIFLANEAINCLMRIPKNDALRSRGLQLVTDWIRRNK